MKAKPFKTFLEDLGISQKFARPRTPNDNPFVESLFATTKGSPEYPGEFTDDVGGITYFTAFFDFFQQRPASWQNRLCNASTAAQR